MSMGRNMRPSNRERLARFQIHKGKEQKSVSEATKPGIKRQNVSANLGDIVIKGANQHNLKNLSISIPRYKLVVITGVSGSGKSSLAFDTIYAEGQRRFVESLSPFLRRQLDQLEKPDVEAILGLSPTIAIEQKMLSRNPRSSVGTVTEIFNYLRVLYSRIGIQHCQACGHAVEPMGPNEITDELALLKPRTRFSISARNATENTEDSIVVFVAPETKSELQDFKVKLLNVVEKALEIGNGRLVVNIEDESLVFTRKRACPECGLQLPDLRASMFSPNTPTGMCTECNGLGFKLAVDPDLIVTKPEYSLLDGASPWFGDIRRQGKKSYVASILFSVAKHYNANLEQPWNQLAESFRHALLYGSKGERIKFTAQAELDEDRWRVESDRVYKGLVYNIDRLFRKTNSDEQRRHYMQFMSRKPCPVCQGERLCKEARNVTVAGKTYPEVARLSIKQVYDWVSSLLDVLPPQKLEIMDELLKDLRSRLSFIFDVGLHYLTLERSAPSLSGGEGQRIQLANQLGSGLVGVLYILDEPSIGLHARDHSGLLDTLKSLRDMGNTILVVEHDEQTIRNADWLIDLGPGAGVMGGRVMAQGTPEDLARNNASITGKYLSGELKVSTLNNGKRRKPAGWLILRGARLHNLKSIDAKIPLGTMTCVTGVSGSGKSSLIAKTLYPALLKELHHAQTSVGPYDSLAGLEEMDKVVNITQAPIGHTPRSNPATYTKVFDEIRKVFASVPEAKARNYKPSQFSFNVKGGRCEECRGHGQKMIEMHFLPDVWVTCQECKGTRFNRQTLEITYKGLNISQALDLDVEQALSFFGEYAKITRVLRTLHDVGLGYIKLGQSANTLSGGEAQRVKLAKELSNVATGRTIYILDEPTTGLHFADIQHLLNVLHRLVDAGNTIVIIEHNLEVIRNADWVIDLGPDGGDAGGYIVGEGTPEDLAKVKGSFTGQYLEKMISVDSSSCTRTPSDFGDS
jgi:excinuclease ABC subunit A